MEMLPVVSSLSMLLMVVMFLVCLAAFCRGYKAVVILIVCYLDISLVCQLHTAGCLLSLYDAFSLS